MMTYEHEDILKFISLFHGNDDFLNGLCYWFAHILNERFPGGCINYAPILCHFFYTINGHAYDVRGEIEPPEKSVPWVKYCDFDELDYCRVLHSCVWKDGE